MEIDKPAIQSVITENKVNIQTVQPADYLSVTTQVAEVPQIQTTLQDNVATITTVLNAPFVEVTSVNGRTGDVVIEPVIKAFQPNFPYPKDAVISYNGEVYIAKVTFTSGATFNPNDWVKMEASSVIDWADITNKPTFATVATSGDYLDLSNQPAINDATLTIQKNGTSVGAFSANSATNVVANIEVPTQTSELTNNSNFPVDANYTHTDNNYTSAEKSKLQGIEAGAQVNPTTAELLDFFYPVGSYYETSDGSFDPNIEWGGTWVEDTSGFVTVAQDNGVFNTVGDTGGTQSNTITNDNIPRGLISVSHIASMEGEFYSEGIVTKGRGAGLPREGSVASLSQTTYSHTYTFGKASPDAMTNLQPYIVVKRWHRTA